MTVAILVISDITKFKAPTRQSMSGFRDSETVGSLIDLGRIIRAKRKSSGMRIDDAAALCGVSVDLFSRLENGKSGVATDRVIKVLDGLGLALRVLDKETAPRE
jgi:hypothetical protein